MWQPCELLHTCYLLTADISQSITDAPYGLFQQLNNYYYGLFQCLTSLKALFGLPLGLGPFTSYTMHFFTQ